MAVEFVLELDLIKNITHSYFALVPSTFIVDNPTREQTESRPPSISYLGILHSPSLSVLSESYQMSLLLLIANR